MDNVTKIDFKPTDHSKQLLAAVAAFIEHNAPGELTAYSKRQLVGLPEAGFAYIDVKSGGEPTCEAQLSVRLRTTGDTYSEDPDGTWWRAQNVEALLSWTHYSASTIDNASRLIDFLVRVRDFVQSLVEDFGSRVVWSQVCTRAERDEAGETKRKQESGFAAATLINTSGQSLKNMRVGHERILHTGACKIKQGIWPVCVGTTGKKYSVIATCDDPEYVNVVRTA